jgi:hypothetical protein
MCRCPRRAAFKCGRRRWSTFRPLGSISARGETYRNELHTIVELLTADRDLENARFAMILSTADLLS